jgi:hypothetical protein
VDFSKYKIHDWLMIGGGAAMLILGMALDWTSVSVAGFSSSGDGPFDYFFTGGIAWILVVVVGVLAFLKPMGKLPETQPWPLICSAPDSTARTVAWGCTERSSGPGCPWPVRS